MWVDGHEVKSGDVVSQWEDSPEDERITVDAVQRWGSSERDKHKGLIVGKSASGRAVISFAGQVFRHSEATKDVSTDGPE